MEIKRQKTQISEGFESLKREETVAIEVKEKTGAEEKEGKQELQKLQRAL